MKVLLLLLSFKLFSYEIGFDYQSLSDDKELLGLTGKILKAYKDAGIDAKFVDTPTKRSFELIKINKIDADAGRFISVINKYNLTYIPVPIHKTKVCAFSDREIKKPLSESRVSTMASAKVTEDLVAKEKMLALSPSSAVKLYKQRENIDYVVGFELLYRQFFKVEKLKMKCVHIIAEEEIFHVVAEKNKHLIPKLIPAFKKHFKDI